MDAKEKILTQEDILPDMNLRMNKSIEILDKGLSGLRTGRVSPGLLESVRIEIHGNKVPLTQVASISTPDARTLSIQVWDHSNISLIEKVISDSNLGLNPNTAGSVIRLNIPMLTEERRKLLAKQASTCGEDTKIAIRTIRGDGNNQLKKLEKEKKITKDELTNLTKEIQKITDGFVAKIDTKVAQKAKEITTV